MASVERRIEGFDILDGVWRTFRDAAGGEHGAYGSAFLLKKKNPGAVVTIRRPDGVIVSMQIDGRTVERAAR